MWIEELVCKNECCRDIVVHLKYDEVRDIANGLYYLTSGKMENCDREKYRRIATKCKFLFDMIKHGYIMPETVEAMAIKSDENTVGTEEK